ncbi:MAG: DUF3108 domain-containing protein [Mariprofundales bacterium]|nr:DUF3108 domain-containing protein [Mariprofundales bacterium]
MTRATRHCGLDPQSTLLGTTGVWLHTIILGVALLWTSTAVATSPCLPMIGERLAFDIDWEFINGGSAVLEYQARAEGGYRILTTARTNRFLDLFKKVRDTITADGICINGRQQSTLFTLDQHENRYRAHKESRFLWRQNQVRYTQNGKSDLYPAPAGNLSVMDAFTRVRQLPLAPGSTVKIPVFDSRKLYQVEVTVGKKVQRLRAPWGAWVECIIVTPHLKTAGIFSSRGSITIWMTNDSRHIPIKMRAKIKIGHILAHLTAYREPTQ